MTRSTLISLDRLWAMPQAARAATPSEPSLLRVSGIAGIAIAVVAILYFAWEFTR